MTNQNKNTVDIAEEQEKLFVRWREILNIAIAQLDNYINTFDQSNFFTFSDNEKKKKQLKKEYFTFMCIFKDSIKKCGDCNAELARMIIAADKQMDAKLTYKLSSVFDNYINVEKELYIYTAASEAELSKSRVSTSLLINSARRLNAALNDFIGKII